MIYSVILFVVLLIPLSVKALVITEIMYDVPGTDTGREWIEVFNNGDSNIDPTQFKLFENSSNHVITLPEIYTNSTSYLGVGEYAVIADNPTKFIEDWPEYSGLLFDSVFSLNNAGEILKIVDTNVNTVDTKEYSVELGAKGDGMSLQFHEGNFIAAKPTPSLTNATQAEDVTPDISTQEITVTNTSSHSEQVDLFVVKEKPAIEIFAGRDRLASIHSPISFSGAKNDNRLIGKVSFLWNFGDGNVSKGYNVDHTYAYPGTYNVVLNAISGRQRAVSRAYVSVFEPEVSLSVGSTSIAIENKSSFELNIGNFILKGLAKPYTFPKDTIISSKQTVYFDIHLFPEVGSTTPVLLFPNKKPIKNIDARMR